MGEVSVFAETEWKTIFFLSLLLLIDDERIINLFQMGATKTKLPKIEWFYYKIKSVRHVKTKKNSFM